ncbi:hypothetical protein AAC387_Pa05g1029 [Persea americana]
MLDASSSSLELGLGMPRACSEGKYCWSEFSLYNHELTCVQASKDKKNCWLRNVEVGCFKKNRAWQLRPEFGKYGLGRPLLAIDCVQIYSNCECSWDA